MKYSYVLFYEPYSQLIYPPEAYYYAARSGNLLPYEATIQGTYRGMAADGFFDMKYFQDLWLEINDFNWETQFLGPSTTAYLNYVTLNIGLGGLFTKVTPKQAIEGYTDARLAMLQQTPVYMGGDATINPFLSID